MEKKVESEIVEFLFNLKTAQSDGFPWGFLLKGENAKRNIQTLGQDAIDSVGSLGLRAIYHVNRLLEEKRSDNERNFALALAQYASEVMKSIDIYDDHLVRATVSGEGCDSCLWWTLSPYVFDILKLKVGDKEAVKLLITWAKTGKPHSEIWDGDKQVNLTGLGNYNFVRSKSDHTFTLSRDPNGKSHQFARQEAQRLVRDIFSTQ